MKFRRTNIPDVVLIEPVIHGDDRGYFMETFRQDKFEEFLGYKVNFIQDNESKSGLGVLRGLHYQLPQFAQSKLVRVIKGSVLDVAVDIRKGSPTFGQAASIELSEKNKLQLFIPRGFAHGFVVLENETIFAYKVDNYYSPENDCGIFFNDESLSIDWQLDNETILVSEKDLRQPKFNDADLFDYDMSLYE